MGSRNHRSCLLVACLLLISAHSFADTAYVKGLRMWPAPDNTRLVFDLSGPVEHSLFTLAGPDRVVLDIQGTRMDSDPENLAVDKSLLKNVRYARRNNDNLRIVLDLKKKVRPKSFLLKPHREYGHRLVVDLYDSEADKPATPVIRTPTRDRPRDVIIAIDAGHGGDDPGALGRRGTREKDVVLAIARKLHSMIAKETGMKPIMIRDGDYYVSLQKRVDKARENQADLFVSIHADAFKSPDAHGSSVFILSDKGASSEAAQFLADSENSADLIGGVSLDDKDDLLKMVLVDMVKNSTIEDSHQIAKNVLSGLRGITRLHKHQVEQASFKVLKAPDVPSILVETAFISNPEEERRLRSSSYQTKLARAILNGTKRYFKDNAPEGTLLAQNNPTRHTISRGETLSAIAARYRISLSELRRFNKLRNDLVHAGQTLHIPYTGS